MRYLVPPGLYAIGEPGEDAPVVVTANYKMSYDMVRRALAGRSVWLLVLETYGINVWCAAGKGTFGTGELVRRVEAVQLGRVVSHRTLLLPLLGAAGVRGVEVRQRTGFRVNFATIRADDLPAYLDSGMQATPAMRELAFTLYDRLVLTPIEMVSGVRNSLPILALFFLAGGLGEGSFDLRHALLPVIAYLGAILAGTFWTPLLLPWLPSRSFAVKGAVVGLGWTALFIYLAGPLGHGAAVPAFLALPAVSAFHSLNFTGSTPFTSRSGVKKEMRLALPAMAMAALAGIVIWLAARFL